MQTLPRRSPLIVDLDEGLMSVEDAQFSTEGFSTPDEILARYLAFVYHMRSLPVGSSISLRDADIEVLATSLSMKMVEVEHSLKRLIADEEVVVAAQRRFRARMILPVAGLVLAACSAGVLIFASGPIDDEVDIGAGAAVTLGVVSDIGNGGAIAVNPGS